MYRIGYHHVCCWIYIGNVPIQVLFVTGIYFFMVRIELCTLKFTTFARLAHQSLALDTLKFMTFACLAHQSLALDSDLGP
ncbi:hypothetical protein QL285_062640 [Trifolium repens]|nr:hypothetical protein QL285_062640 [Trifolium repens]